MANYINVGGLKIRTPLANTLHDGDADAIEKYLIDYAEAEINGALASHYSTPFSDSNPTVEDLTYELCIAKLLQTVDPEKAETARKAVYDRIERIKKGDEHIITGSGTAIPPSGSSVGVWSNTKDYHPVHSMLDARSPYTRVDSSALDAMENERS